MASITIRNLDDEVKTRLRLQAAGHGRSMEEEARSIIREAVEREKSPSDLVAAIRSRFASLGGVELESDAEHRRLCGHGCRSHQPMGR